MEYEGCYYFFIHLLATFQKLVTSLKKLILINPRSRHRIGFLLNRESKYPPLGLGIIAALTPTDWEIKLIDENFDDFVFEDADLIGITSFTSTISRAYEIAAEYTSNNIPVILGGIYASLCNVLSMHYEHVNMFGNIWTSLHFSLWYHQILYLFQFSI